MVTTPDGAKFVDRAALARQTGHPVRTHYKNPGDPDVLPPADAMIVCPATVNTVNKWAAGITDTLALGLLVEGAGHGGADRRGAVHERGDGRATRRSGPSLARLRRVGRHGGLRRPRRTACTRPARGSGTCTPSPGTPAWPRCAARRRAGRRRSAGRAGRPAPGAAGAPGGGGRRAPARAGKLAGREHNRIRRPRSPTWWPRWNGAIRRPGRRSGTGSAWCSASPTAAVRRVACVVDVVPETVDEALAAGADMIVAHHPLLLRGVSSVAADHLQGADRPPVDQGRAWRCTWRTPTPTWPTPGVSDALAARFGLTGLRPLHRPAPGSPGRRRRAGASAGSASCPPPMTLAELTRHAAAVLPVTVLGSSRRRGSRAYGSYPRRQRRLGGQLPRRGDRRRGGRVPHRRPAAPPGRRAPRRRRPRPAGRRPLGDRTTLAGRPGRPPAGGAGRRDRGVRPGHRPVDRARRRTRCWTTRSPDREG